MRLGERTYLESGVLVGLLFEIEWGGVRRLGKLDWSGKDERVCVDG